MGVGDHGEGGVAGDGDYWDGGVAGDGDYGDCLTIVSAGVSIL